MLLRSFPLVIAALAASCVNRTETWDQRHHGSAGAEDLPEGSGTGKRRPKGGAQTSDDAPGDAPGTGTKDESFEAWREGDTKAQSLSLASPKPWQVWQRADDHTGKVTVRLTVPGGGRAQWLRMRLRPAGDGEGTWQTVGVKPGESVEAAVKGKEGAWQSLEAIVFDGDKKILARGVVDRVGIGEVFLVAGQSNSTNCGDTPGKPTSGYVASTDGERWQEANDPQIGAHDIALCRGGSSWPAAGDALYARLKVPVAFASTGYSGTSSAEWLPGAGGKDLYAYTLNRGRQLQASTGFRAVLWHQGENDTVDGTSQAVYAQRLGTIIATLRKDLGVTMPWVVAQASFCADYHYGRRWGESPAVRAAQAGLWNPANKIFPGPDTDALKGEYRARNDTDCHWSVKGALKTGQLWAEKIMALMPE